MGKVLGGLGIAATGAAASAGAIYLSRKANFDSTLPEELATFEKEGHSEGCLAKLFPELEKIAAETEIGDTDKVESNFFGSNDDKKQTESCLVINWNKQEFGTEKKWKGNFRFLWTAKNEKAQKGFVVFAIATPTSGKKFKWTGVAYSMAKDKDKWSSSKKLSIAENKEVDPNDNKFPTPKTPPTPKYWGFMKDVTSDLGKVCGENDCKESDPTPTLFEGYWSWKSGSEEADKDKLGTWTEHLSTIWKEVFGDEKWKMDDLTKDIQGTWTEEVWYGVDREQSKAQ